MDSRLLRLNIYKIKNNKNYLFIPVPILGYKKFPYYLNKYFENDINKYFFLTIKNYINKYDNEYIENINKKFINTDIDNYYDKLNNILNELYENDTLKKLMKIEYDLYFNKSLIEKLLIDIINDKENKIINNEIDQLNNKYDLFIFFLFISLINNDCNKYIYYLKYIEFDLIKYYSNYALKWFINKNHPFDLKDIQLNYDYYFNCEYKYYYYKEIQNSIIMNAEYIKLKEIHKQLKKYKNYMLNRLIKRVYYKYENIKNSEKIKITIIKKHEYLNKVLANIIINSSKKLH